MFCYGCLHSYLWHAILQTHRLIVNVLLMIFITDVIVFQIALPKLTVTSGQDSDLPFSSNWACLLLLNFWLSFQASYLLINPLPDKLFFYGGHFCISWGLISCATFPVDSCLFVLGWLCFTTRWNSRLPCCFTCGLTCHYCFQCSFHTVFTPCLMLSRPVLPHAQDSRCGFRPFFLWGIAHAKDLINTNLS